MTNIPGWAFAAPEVRNEYVDDFLKALDTLNIPRPTIDDGGVMHYTREVEQGINAARQRASHGYAHQNVQLTHPDAGKLTPRQKLLIADGGNACFGGVVNGNNVKIYTD